MDCFFSDFRFQDLLRSFFPVFERKNKFTFKTLPIEHVFLWSAHWANAKKCKIWFISWYFWYFLSDIDISWFLYLDISWFISFSKIWFDLIIYLISFRGNSFFSERKDWFQCSECESTWKLYLKTSIPLNMLPTSSLHQNFAEPEVLESAVSFEKIQF